MQIRITRLVREGSPPPGLRLLWRNCHANPIRWLADGFAGSNPTCPATQSSQTGGPQEKNSVQRAHLGEPFLALRMCRRPSAACAAPAGRPLLHDRSVLRQARIADRICRRSCLHDCTPLHAASDVIASATRSVRVEGLQHREAKHLALAGPSADRSARRATPMPCGSRPSIAALTRSGARKASGRSG